MKSYLVIAETKYSNGLMYLGKYNISSSFLVHYTPDRNKSIIWTLEKEKDCNLFCDYLNKTLGSKFEFVVIKFKK